MKKTKIFLAVLIFALSFSMLDAQIARQTGTIKGTVSDNEGTPLPGVSVTTTSPALIGSISDLTDNNGNFRLVALPSGTYLVVCELAGFKTTRQEGIVVRTGMTVSITLSIEPSDIQEEVTVTAPSPTVDVQSTKTAIILDSEVLQRLPLNRNIDDALSVAPGVVGKIGYQSGTVHGVDAWNHVFELDGVNTNSPTHNSQLVFVHYDAIEEVEVAIGGLPAYVGAGGGSFFNIVTKSGGNELHGQVQAYYTREDLAQVLFPDEQLNAMGIGKPTFAIFDWDVSGSLGGPIIKDKIWFFLDLGRLSKEDYGRFIPTTILGQSYDVFNLPHQRWQGMAKVTAQFSKNLRFFTMFHGELEDREVYDWWATRNTYEATFAQDNNYRIATVANLSWIPSANTIVDFKAGLARRYFPIWYRDGNTGAACYRDRYTGYIWNAPTNWASTIVRQSRQASTRLTHFQDDFLGGDHELSAGIEWQWGEDDWAWFRQTPLNIYWYNENIYYYRGLYGLDGPHPTYGDGWIGGPACGPEDGDSATNGSEHRYGAYIQDSMTIKNRLTINFGVRFDTYTGYMPEDTKKATTGILNEIGDSILTPRFGLNTFDAYSFPGNDDAMGWTSISPRFGVSYDLFGNGKTSLKVSLSQYAEAMPVMFFNNRLSPFSPQHFDFYWWDLNNNQQVDSPGIDSYTYKSGDVKFMDAAYNKLGLGTDIVAPKYNEITASIDHELLRDLRVTLQYIYKNKVDMLGSVLWDPDTQRYWYQYEKASDWWIPFSTVIPAYDEFEEQSVTLYFPSNDSPYGNQFNQFINVPEAKRKYSALELTFDKRYSNGWSLGGSFVFSSYKGMEPNNNANEWVNNYGQLPQDIPLMIKIYGSFNVPLGFVTSFYYTHFEGTPYTRTVTVYPPSDWAAANNAGTWAQSVNVEAPGDRREQSTDNVDFRLEKEFRLPMGKVGMFLDVFNLLGNRYTFLGLNPGGNWRPAAPGTAAGGTFSASGNYGRLSGIQGTRTFKFSLRFTF